MTDSSLTTIPHLPSELPVIPLRETVVFPLTLQPLAVNRPVSVESIDRALGRDRMLLLLQQLGDADDPTPADLRRIGTVVIIRQMAKNPAAIQVVVEGVARVKAIDVTRTANSLSATVEAWPEDQSPSLEVDAYVRRIRELSERALSFASGLSQDLRSIVAGIDNPLRLCYVIASMLDLKGDAKQQLLEEDRLVTKLHTVATELGLPADLFKKHDLHVHVPAGAIPKDGPSAGVTMATAILSAIRKQPVRTGLAMTGEITLSGAVLPVGGIREKALAARRYGITTFILPEQNAVDIPELPEEVRRDMTFVPVKLLDEVLAIALPPSDAPALTPKPAPGPDAIPEPQAVEPAPLEA